MAGTLPSRPPRELSAGFLSGPAARPLGGLRLRRSGRLTGVHHGALAIVVDRFMSLGGGATITKRVAADTWSYPNIHGDVVTTANAVGAKQGLHTVLRPLRIALAAPPDNSSGNYDFGWFGQNQRGLEPAPDTTPTIEMGARP